VSANKFLPKWYKDRKPNYVTLDQSMVNPLVTKHAKQCPAIQDYMIDGVVIPAWSDIIIVANHNGVAEWNISVGGSSSFDDTFLANQNQKQITGMGLWDIENVGVLKLNTPYMFETPKGYGTHFYDPFYHHRNNIRLLPGRVETDLWHEVNFPFEFDNTNVPKESRLISVKAGEPLVVASVYKKSDKTKLNLHKYTEEKKYLYKHNNALSHSLSGNWHRTKKILNEEE
jgi:hypothetical protein